MVQNFESVSNLLAQYFSRGNIQFTDSAVNTLPTVGETSEALVPTSSTEDIGGISEALVPTSPIGDISEISEALVPTSPTGDISEISETFTQASPVVDLMTTAETTNALIAALNTLS